MNLSSVRIFSKRFTGLDDVQPTVQVIGLQPLGTPQSATGKYLLAVSDSQLWVHLQIEGELAELVHTDQIGVGQLVRLLSVRKGETYHVIESLEALPGRFPTMGAPIALPGSQDSLDPLHPPPSHQEALAQARTPQHSDGSSFFFAQSSQKVQKSRWQRPAEVKMAASTANCCYETPIADEQSSFCSSLTDHQQQIFYTLEVDGTTTTTAPPTPHAAPAPPLPAPAPTPLVASPMRAADDSLMSAEDLESSFDDSNSSSGESSEGENCDLDEVRRSGEQWNRVVNSPEEPEIVPRRRPAQIVHCAKDQPPLAASSSRRPHRYSSDNADDDEHDELRRPTSLKNGDNHLRNQVTKLTSYRNISSIISSPIIPADRAKPSYSSNYARRSLDAFPEKENMDDSRDAIGGGGGGTPKSLPVTPLSELPPKAAVAARVLKEQHARYCDQIRILTARCAEIQDAFEGLQDGPDDVAIERLLTLADHLPSDLHSDFPTRSWKQQSPKPSSSNRLTKSTEMSYVGAWTRYKDFNSDASSKPTRHTAAPSRARAALLAPPATRRKSCEITATKLMRCQSTPTLAFGKGGL